MAAFERFIAYRREHVRVGYSTKKAILDRLVQLKALGADLSVCVNQSITRGWADVFLPKVREQVAQGGIALKRLRLKRKENIKK